MTEKRGISFPGGLFMYLVMLDLLLIVMAVAGRVVLGWQPLSAFYVFFYGAQAALVLAALGLAQALIGVFRRQARHRITGTVTLCLGLLPLGCALVTVGPAGFSAPLIHDITTDMDNPPQFSIISSLRTAGDNSLDYGGEPVAGLQRQAFPAIQPVLSDLSPEAAQAKALDIVEDLGWVLVVHDESLGQIEAYDRSALFGFIDDVVIRVTPANGGSRLDIRSVSRVGRGDLGANARRIRRFVRAFTGENTVQ